MPDRLPSRRYDPACEMMFEPDDNCESEERIMTLRARNGD